MNYLLHILLILLISAFNFNAYADMIPRKIIFGNPERTSVKISPNGKYISYLAPKDGVLNVWLQKIDGTESKALTYATQRGIRFYCWSYDNNILFLQDNQGDENWQLSKVDIDNNKITELVNIPNVTVGINNLSHKFPNEILITLNKDNPETKDLYKLNLTNGKYNKIFDNTKQRFVRYITDNNLNLRFAYRIEENGDGTYYRANYKNNNFIWQDFLKIPYEDTATTYPVDFTLDNNSIYFLDSREHNYAALVKFNIKDNAKELIYTDDKADITSVLIDEKTKQIMGMQTEHLKKTWVPLNEQFKQIVESQDFFKNNFYNVTSSDLDDKKWIVTQIQDDMPVSYHLYDKEKNELKFLFSSEPELAKFKLNKTKPLTIKSRDGLDLVCYLTLPEEKLAQNLPIVLLVHGGPAVRDSWQMNSIHQWLSNRGYAVMSVNYRGSAGLGKKFFAAGSGEWGKKMHLDLIDVVNWTTEQKIADPKKIAIMGGSYGGYATLLGLTITPDIFACGIDIVGVSNLETLLKSIPPYWKPAKGFLVRQIGANDDSEEGRAYLASVSPLTYVGNIKKPLIIAQGANDPRVKQAESEQIVDAMRAKNIPVTYLLYPDEGHGFARPENRMSFYAKVEEFLAKILGGKAERIHPEDISNSSMIEK